MPSIFDHVAAGGDPAAFDPEGTGPANYDPNASGLVADLPSTAAAVGSSLASGHALDDYARSVDPTGAYQPGLLSAPGLVARAADAVHAAAADPLGAAATIGKGVAGSIYSGVTLPGDVLQGKVDPTDASVLPRVFDTVGLMAGAGLPMAEDGALGAAGGRLTSGRIPAGKNVIQRFVDGDGNPDYTVYAKSDTSRSDPIATMQLNRHDDGRYEVGMVDVNPDYRRQGVATDLYARVQKDIGTPMQPSGNLMPDGYAFWQNRDPTAVQYHRQVPEEGTGGSYYSPKQLLASTQEKTFLGPQPYQDAFDALPPEAKTPEALAAMFARGDAAAPVALAGHLGQGQADRFTLDASTLGDINELLGLGRDWKAPDPYASNNASIRAYQEAGSPVIPQASAPPPASRTVDPAAGEARLYHGTAATQDFSRFDPSITGPNVSGHQGGAVFLTPDPQEAGAYARMGQPDYPLMQGEAGARVIPADVDLGRSRVYDLPAMFDAGDPRLMAGMRGMAEQSGQGGPFDRMVAREQASRAANALTGAADPGLGIVFNAHNAALGMAREDGLDTAILRGLKESDGADQVAVLTPGRVRGALSGNLLYSSGLPIPGAAPTLPAALQPSGNALMPAAQPAGLDPTTFNALLAAGRAT